MTACEGAGDPEGSGDGEEFALDSMEGGRMRRKSKRQVLEAKDVDIEKVSPVLFYPIISTFCPSLCQHIYLYLFARLSGSIFLLGDSRQQRQAELRGKRSCEGNIRVWSEEIILYFLLSFETC